MLDDVIAAMENATILRPPASIVGDRVRLVEDFDEAKKRGTSAAWRDARSSEVARIVALTQKAPNGAALCEAVRGLAEPLGELVVTRLPARFAEIANEVAADLQNVVLDRMVPRGGTGLFARMWMIYVQGGWPCGLDGDTLVAYCPPIDRDGIAVQ